MNKGRVVLLVVAAFVFLSVGFVIGQMVQAAGTVPGTSGDPLVAQSYVEKIVGKTVVELEKKLSEMEAKVLVIQEKIDKISSNAGKQTPSSGSSNNTGTSSSGSSSDATKKPDNSIQGKTVTVSDASANVRSGPGTTYGKVASLKQGDTAKVILEENSWYKIALVDGKEGWIANWLVKVK